MIPIYEVKASRSVFILLRVVIVFAIIATIHEGADASIAIVDAVRYLKGSL